MTPYLKNNIKFKTKRFKQVENFNSKLSVDYYQDFKNVEKIFNYFKPNIYFSIKSVFKKNYTLKFHIEE